MKQSILSVLLLVLCLSSTTAQNPVAQALDSLLLDSLFVTGDVSLAVYDLTADSMLYSHRAQKSVRPASVMKVLTSVVALDELGSGYNMRTALYSCNSASSSSVPYRNCYVKGGMDPLFNEEDMVSMASSIPKGTVIDTLFADCSMTDSLYWGPGWSWDDNPYGYQPYISSLLLCGGAVEVVVKPTSKGCAPEYTCTPESSFYTVVNEAECGNPELDKLTVLRDWLTDSNVIRIRGNCIKEKKETLNMYKSADFFMAVLLEKLEAAGVSVKNVASGRVPAGAELVHEVLRPIESVVDEALMESDNICAESLLYNLCAKNGMFPVSMACGSERMAHFVKKRLHRSSGYNIADGSGLSLYNYITAGMFIDLLRYAYGKRSIYDVLYRHLPLSGVSGTMKNRTKGSAAYKKIRAKTGTVKGVCSLAGYARASNGNNYAFVILNTGIQSARLIREWQDKVCTVLCE